jgi:ubiquinone biosynthesis protein
VVVNLDLELGELLILPFWIAGLGWLIGRVLGVKLGRWRAGVAAALGWLFGLTIVSAIAPEGEQVGPFTLEVAVFAVLSALPWAILLDLLTLGEGPSRRPVRRLLRHPIRWLKGVFAPIGRFRELVRNARAENLMHLRYGSTAALDSSDFARRLRLVLERSGGMFVKFGQIASTRTDLLPEPITTELSHLQAEVPPAAEDDVREVLDTELGEPAETAFAAFAREPLASASIGQTHRATLHDGEQVVVKVQRPGIDELVRRDSTVLAFAARQIERRVESARRLGARRLAGELIVGIEEELDYGHEAAAGMRLRENRADDEGIAVPAVHSTLSTGRVLVMEAVTGRSIADREAVDSCPVPRPELARRLLASMLGQILDDGFYHADPHPGNVMVDPEGTMWLLDFGAVGRLDPVTLEGLQGIALGFTMSDPNVLARAVRHLADDDLSVDLRVLERELGTLLGEFGAAGGLSPEVMREVLAVMDRHDMEPPGQMVLLSRTLLTLEGTLRGLDPAFQLSTSAMEIVRAKHGLGAEDIKEIAERELIHALPSLRTLPDHADALANQLRLGRLTIRTERLATQDRAVIDQWLNRTLVAVAGSSGAVASGIVLVAGALAHDHGVRLALWVLGFSGLALSGAIVMRTVAQSLRGLPARRVGIERPPAPGE